MSVPFFKFNSIKPNSASKFVIIYLIQKSLFASSDVYKTFLTPSNMSLNHRWNGEFLEVSWSFKIISGEFTCKFYII